MLLIPGVIASSYPKASGAFESIASATGTGSSNTISFTSIPQTYQSLQLRILGRGSSGTVENVSVRCNNNGSNIYTRHQLKGDGATATANGAISLAGITQSFQVPGNTGTANAMGVAIIDIHNYTSTSQNKTIRIFAGNDLNDTNGTIYLTSGLFIDTTAVTEVNLITSSNWTTTSQFALYGIKGA
jgi:hypothetical protein